MTMASKINEEEAQQLLRTVEMFEAIVESQPADYQSLEILKETYNKLSRQPDSQRVSKQLAGVYAGVGQISQAILEYEGILQECPGDAKVRAALAKLVAKTSKLGAQTVSGAPSMDEDSKPTPPASTLAVGAGAPRSAATVLKPEEGDRALAEVLIDEKLVTRQAVQPLLQRLKEQRPVSVAQGQPLCLVQLLVDDQIAKLDDILATIVDKARLPYLPLAIYDVDRDTACLLPRDVSCQLGILAFDAISRSVLVATTNPFDSAARNLVRTTLKQNLFWFVTSPAELTGALRKAHGLDAKSQPTRIGAKP